MASPPPSSGQAVSPYHILAAGYDFVMAHVAYGYWATFIEDLLDDYQPDARSILELGCGTASLALELQPRGDFLYRATDASEQMVRVAEHKIAEAGVPIDVAVADFRDFTVDAPVDVVLLLYDGLNYVLEPDDVARMLRCAYAALKPGGVFIVDQSTPANSIKNEAYFEDAGEQEGFSYVRTSRYDPDAQLHTTRFEIAALGQTFTEVHVQRAYPIGTIRALVEAAGFEVVEALDGFSDDPADDDSERVHWILRRPTGEENERG